MCILFLSLKGRSLKNPASEWTDKSTTSSHMLGFKSEMQKFKVNIW